MLNNTYSKASLHQLSPYIQTLYEYYLTYTPKSIQDKRKFLENYTNDLKSQKVLNWDRFSQQTILSILLRIRDFTFWISKHQNLAHPQELEFAATIKESYNFLKDLNHTKFLSPLTNKEKQYLNHKSKVHKSFPVDKIMNLINSFDNPMYKILFIFLAFGGTRISNLLHLMVIDVKVEDKLKVILAHPELSKIGKLTRTEYLQKYDLIPRIQLTSRHYVGFQGMNFDNPKDLTSEIHFIGAIEPYLISLHQKYMTYRKQFKHHPYYFVSQNGNPLPIASVMRIMERKCKEIGLNVGRSSNKEGITTYSLRHFYGYYASQVLKLDKVIVQKLMGLTKIEYVEKYHVNYEKTFLEIDKVKSKRINHE